MGPPLPPAAPVERALDWTLKNVGVVRVSNSRGKIEVRGWAQDRIRAVWVTVSERPETVQVHIQEVQGRIEVTVRYGTGLSVDQKLKERTTPIARADLVVYAPARYPVEVLGVDEAVSLKNWKASAEVRSIQGPISVSEYYGKKLSVHCPQCPVSLAQARSRVLNINGGKGSIIAKQVRSEEAFFSSSEGAIRVDGGSGVYTVSTSSGSVSVEGFRGTLEFVTDTGAVEVRELSGFLSGRSTSGSIQATVKDWIFRDRAFVESDTGEVHLTLPRAFIGELEVGGGAAHGRPTIDFELSHVRESQGRILGVVRQATELLRVVSRQGKVAVLRAGIQNGS
jgi:hypothetical protein